MDKDVQRLYDELRKTSLFKNMPQCKTCGSACKAPKWMSWLLPEEVPRFRDKYKIDIISENGASFLKDGQCKLHKQGTGCTIFNERPLECRLSPLLFLNVDGKAWWILAILCPIIGDASKQQLEEMKKKALVFIDAIEPYMTGKIESEIRQICDAIGKS